MYNSTNIADKIKQLSKIKGITTTKLLLDCGLNKNVLSTMMSGGCLPRTETLAKIADYFNVSIDYLLGRSDNTSISNSIELNITGRDKEILTAYKNNPDVQLAVDRLLKIESENNNKKINIQTAYVAARSTDNTPPRIETGDFSDIINAPDSTDEY